MLKSDTFKVQRLILQSIFYYSTIARKKSSTEWRFINKWRQINYRGTSLKRTLTRLKVLSALERCLPRRDFTCFGQKHRKILPKKCIPFRHACNTLYPYLIATETSLKTIWHEEINFI